MKPTSFQLAEMLAASGIRALHRDVLAITRIVDTPRAGSARFMLPGLARIAVATLNPTRQKP